MEKFYLYNTLTKRVDEFVPREAGKVSMYTCGPTVYRFAHIGNLRSYIMEDVLEKFLRYIGYDVKRVMNITDVGHLSSDGDTGEDKMVSGAKREGKTVMELAKFYENAFFDDCRKLNIKTPDVVEPATNCIAEYIKLIEKLFENGYAYEAGGNIYFDTSKLKDYYQLTGHSSDDLLVGVRSDVEEDGNKRNKSDFVLWFTKSKFDSQELKWNSPWGVGYPGWHIECSAISMKHLGEYLDLHCGGVDNIFPHHTNEIAQSEAAVGHPWCSHWFHVQHLNDREGKMSKSKGNILTVSVLQEKGYDPLVYRMFCLQSHYRKPLEFSYDTLDNSKAAYERLLNRIAGIPQEGETNAAQFEDNRRRFIEKVGNDLNTSLGLTVLYDLLKDSVVNGATKRAIIADFDRVLSLNLLSGGTNTAEEHSDEFVRYVEGLIRERAEAKKNKNYARADEIRAELAEKGVKELILVAQETTMYGTDLYGEKRLPQLLRALCKISGLRWIRILYCYPEEITDELIQVIKEEPKICHYLDLPIQHASDRILKRMGRRTTQAELVEIVNKLRREIPDIVLRTTLISGFPGETQEDHEELMGFVDEMEFDRLGVFTYSPEEDTPAATMPDQVAEEVKEARRDEIMELQQEISYDKGTDRIGQELLVMIEGKVADESAYIGRTYGDAPKVDGYIFVQTGELLMTGDFAKVRVTGALEYDLIGELADEYTE